MRHKEFLNELTQSIGLRIGPFIYQMRAYDDWGVQILKQIQRYITVTCLSDDDRIDRTIHLVNLADDLTQATLPAQLQEYLPTSAHELEWSHLSNQANSIWQAKDSTHTFWTATSGSKFSNLRFEFPWSIIINDIVNRGGGLLHAGLACHKENGLLFLAPPCGGKTTTLNSAPSDWQVLSDDAALVWPDSEKNWHASPLPAWGMIIKPDQKWRYPQMALGQSCRLKSLLVLQKDQSVSLKKLQAADTMPFIYRALSEYPVTLIAEAVQAESFFRTAAAMARKLNKWELSLSLHGDIWPLVSREAA